MENFKIGLAHIPSFIFWIIIAIYAAILFLSYRRIAKFHSSRLGYLLFFLKLLAMGFLVLLFLEPVLSWQYRGKERSDICVLVDGSRSMGLKSERNLTRAEVAFQVIGSEYFQELAKKFKLHYFQFSQGVLELGESDLGLIKSPEGRFTNTAQALEFVNRNLKDKGISSCVLISDGANNWGEDPVRISREIGIPVYTIAIPGSSGKSVERKVSILNVRFNRRIMVDNLAQIEVVFKSQGFQNQKATLELRQQDRIVFRKQVLLDVSIPMQKASIKWIPGEVGTFQYRVLLYTDEGGRVPPAEYTFTSTVESPHLNLLYIEGTPRWEFKFLKRALEADSNIDLTCFLRMGKTKFLQVDAGSESKRKAFPNTIEEISRYQIVIIGDVERKFLGDEFLSNLSTCVSEMGTGLLFLGSKAIGSGDYEHSPVAQALPVVAGTPEFCWIAGDFCLNLTKEGSLHPIFNYIEDPGANRKFWSSLPAMSGCVPVRAVKAGATVLAVNSAVQGNPVVLAVQNFGKGKTAFWGVDTTWKWKVSPSQPGSCGGQEDAYQKFWGQLFRWLALREPPEAGPQIEVALQKDHYDMGEPFRAIICVSGVKKSVEGSEPVPQVQAVLSTPEGEDINLSLSPVGAEAGEFYVDYFPESPGRYRIAVQGKAGDVMLEKKEISFTVSSKDIETDRPETDPDLLLKIAEASGGKCFSVENIASLPAEVTENKSRATKIKVEKRLSDLFYLFGFIGAISLEWIIRKRRDMF